MNPDEVNDDHVAGPSLSSITSMEMIVNAIDSDGSANKASSDNDKHLVSNSNKNTSMNCKVDTTHTTSLSSTEVNGILSPSHHIDENHLLQNDDIIIVDNIDRSPSPLPDFCELTKNNAMIIQSASTTDECSIGGTSSKSKFDDDILLKNDKDDKIDDSEKSPPSSPDYLLFEDHSADDTENTEDVEGLEEQDIEEDKLSDIEDDQLLDFDDEFHSLKPSSSQLYPLHNSSSTTMGGKKDSLSMIVQRLATTLEHNNKCSLLQSTWTSSSNTNLSTIPQSLPPNDRRRELFNKKGNTIKRDFHSPSECVYIVESSSYGSFASF